MTTPQRIKTARGGNMELKGRLVHAATDYDRRQSTKRGYNHHALAQYFDAIDHALELVLNGRTIEEALNLCFNDRLLTVLLKAAKS